MRHISKELREAMEESTLFYPVAKITFADGRTKDIGDGDFNISGNSIVDSAYSDSFPLGILASKQITLSLINDEDQWSEYDFYGAKIFLQTKYKLDSGLIETLNIGTFTVITPETYGTTVEFTAMDDGYKADKPYSTTLSFPVAAGVALRDSCQTCGITLLTGTFANDNYVIPQAPTDITHRQFIGMCAMIAGGNARFDEYNRLMIMPYDFSYFEKYGLDGGRFDKVTPYETGDTADGGSFVPWNTGDTADGGEFGDRADIHVLYEFKTGMRLGVDDVVITGVQITDEEKNVHLYGAEGYVLDLSNQLATGKEDQVVQLIGRKIVGLRFRPFDVDHIAYPMAEFMDLAYIIDRKQNVYQTVITDVTFNYYGYTTLKCNADSPIRNSSTYYGNETKAIVAARKNTEKQISDYDRAVQQLTTLITQSFGVFKTEEVLEDGSTIFYMHNKPTPAESNTIWKMTADAFAVSTDGGKTWNAGMDSQGNAVVNVLSAVGINFDWARGGTLTLGGNNNISGSMRILNSAGQQIGKWDKDGISATTGTFSGNLSAAGGTFAGNFTITDNNNNQLFYADYLSKQLKINAGNVYIGSSTVTDNFVDMAATLKIANDNINLKVSKGDVSSEISAESGKIAIKSNRLSIESTNFTLTEAGKITAKEAVLSNATIQNGSIVQETSTAKLTISNAELFGGYAGEYENSIDFSNRVNNVSTLLIHGGNGVRLSARNLYTNNPDFSQYSYKGYTGNANGYVFVNGIFIGYNVVLPTSQNADTQSIEKSLSAFQGFESSDTRKNK